jgi:hypothetical protein
MFTGGILEVIVLTVACIGLFWAWINWNDILKIDLSQNDDYDGEKLITENSTSVFDIGTKIH